MDVETQLVNVLDAEPALDTWTKTMGVLIIESTSVAHDAGAERASPMTWAAFNADMERTLLLRVQPDGKTLHSFTRLASLDWEYKPYNADVLIEWATLVVMARDNPALLGPLH